MREVCRFYELSRTRLATLQIAPEALPADWPRIAAEFGLEHTSTWVKLQRFMSEPLALPTVEAPLRIEPVAEEHLQEWARVVVSGFGMPADFDTLAIGADPELCHRFAAWDGPRIVAGASVVIDGDTAGMMAASTLPSHRRRGAQSALLLARLQEAAKRGAR